MRGRLLRGLACWVTLWVCGVQAAPADDVLARGARDGDTPAWKVSAATPAGWTRDCCVYARAIGVAAVVYQGDWTGKPQQVMVLNVWPRKLATLAEDVQADRQRYLQLDPAGRVDSFTVRHPAMPCEASVYQGSDHIDDVLVFCDPGVASGVRLSWSMAIDANDPTRQSLLDALMGVVIASRWSKDAEIVPTHAR